MNEYQLMTAADLRAELLHTIEDLRAGRISDTKANSVAQISNSFHQSLKQEWEMAIQAHQELGFGRKAVVKLIGVQDDQNFIDIET